MTTAYFWRGDYGEKRNFGDELNALLLSHFSDINAKWSEPWNADILCGGSSLDVLPRTDYHGYVIGAGQLHESTRTDLRYATVLGLRGKLTRDRVVLAKHAIQPVLGDVGLLASEMATPIPNRYEIGVVAHLTDTELYPRELANARKYGYAEPINIDVTDDPIRVIETIGSCRKIIASSLHGIVTADAFHIPRRTEIAPALIDDSVHEGGIWKFRDYESAIGQAVKFGVLQIAPRVRIEEIQRDLFNCFSRLKEMYRVL